MLGMCGNQTNGSGSMEMNHTCEVWLVLKLLNKQIVFVNCILNFVDCEI